ncbi:hypothetical protein BD289DRAFT_443007 [Coniella lustricola]|uniref:Uncharacterized protein n=1 Tax=Coniella lustricola TaxID=2025994 RepID=A0A2T2ZXI5_9PEZI|nr:hypothetical protein BD289DRAFT_443007 [Coniella lustricola]
MPYFRMQRAFTRTRRSGGLLGASSSPRIVPPAGDVDITKGGRADALRSRHLLAPDFGDGEFCQTPTQKEQNKKKKAREFPPTTTSSSSASPASPSPKSRVPAGGEPTTNARVGPVHGLGLDRCVNSLRERSRERACWCEKPSQTEFTLKKNNSVPCTGSPRLGA